MEKTLKVILGFSCNNNCIFCLDEKNKNIKTRTTAEIIDEIEKGKKEGAANIVFTGGEPTIRQDIFELVSYAKQSGFQKIRIQTNGRMFYYRDFCEKLIRCGADRFDIHIQGHRADLNDSMARSKDSFIQAEAGIRNLKLLGQEVTATIVLNRYNLPFLEDMLSFADMHEIKDVCVSPAGCPDETYENNSVRSNFLSEVERKRKEISKNFKDTDISWLYDIDNQKTGSEKNFKVVFVWFSYAPWSGKTASAPRTSTIYIAKVLEMHGFECVCVDVDMLKDISLSFYTGKDVKNAMNKLIGIVDRQNPDLVAVGSWSPSMPFAAEFIKQFKEQSKDTMVVLGGFNATILPEETLSIIPEVDCLVRGAGEVTMKELASSIRDGKDWRKVSNIAYLKEGKTISTQQKRHCFELDSIPYLDFENVYGLKSKKFNHISLMTSRGCKYDCTFCSVRIIHDRYIEHSPLYTIAQIKHFSDLYEFSSIVFRDDSFMNNPPRAEKLARSIIDNKMDHLHYSYQARANQIDYDVMAGLRKAGFSSVYVGLESPKPEILEFYNKRVDYKNHRQNAFKMVDKLNRLKILLNAAFVFGAPVETEDDLNSNHAFIREILERSDSICVDANILTPYPGTSLWRDYKKGLYGAFKGYEYYNGIFRKYSDTLSMTPQNFLLRHKIYSDDKFLKILTEVKRKIDEDIKRYEYKNDFSPIAG